MISYLRSTQHRPTIRQFDDVKPGTWIRSERRAMRKSSSLLPMASTRTSLPMPLTHEVPRIEYDAGWTYFITRAQMLATTLMITRHRFFLRLAKQDSHTES